MARIRSIKPEFWTSEQVLECSPITRLMFVGMWNFADDCGRMPMSPKSVKAQIFPSDDISLDSVRGMIQELSANGLVLIYSVDDKEYLQITGWAHQRIDKPQPAKYPAPFFDDSRNTPRPLPPDTIGKDKKGEDKKEDIRAVAKATRPTDEKFEEFWKAKPSRAGADPKAPAAKLFHAAVKAGTPADEIIAAARRWAAVDAGKVGTEYLPQAVKWLRDKRWLDYPQETIQPSGEVRGFYAKADSPQLDAWDAHHRKTKGKNLPRDRSGGWRVDSEWPPDYVPPERVDHTPFVPKLRAI